MGFLKEAFQAAKAGYEMEKKAFQADKRGQVSGLIALIAVVGVAGIILMTVYNSVLTTSAFSTNSTLLTVQNTFMPLFILAGVAGAVIAVLLFSFGGRR